MKLQLAATLALLALVMLFAIQNAALVEIRLLLWEVTLSRSLLIFLMLLVGVVIGWFARTLFTKRRVRDR